jgi:hypothetical protein
MDLLHSKIFIIDDFYDNPDIIREYALHQAIHNYGYHPGLRTLSCFNKEAHDKIVKIMSSPITPSGDCYAFQYNTENDVSWIHSDIVPNEIFNQTDKNFWAAVVYLTPNAPIDSGTSLYIDKKYNVSNMKELIHKNTYTRSESEKIIGELSLYGSDISKWYTSTKIGNVYNRMVIYDAAYYHQSNRYFGNSKDNCRLIQIFFFNTNKNDTDVNKAPIKYRINDSTNYEKTIEQQNIRRGYLESLEV